MCLLLLIVLIVTSRSSSDPIDEFLRKEYIVDVTDLENLVKDLATRQFHSNEFISSKKFWIRDLDELYQQIKDLIYTAFGEKIFCDFNSNYINPYIQTIEKFAELDQNDLATIHTVKKLPGLIKSCRLKLSPTFLQVFYPWETLVADGEDNFKELSQYWRGKFNLNLIQAKNRVADLKLFVKNQIPTNVQNDLTNFVMLTMQIRSQILLINEIIKSSNPNKQTDVKIQVIILRDLVQKLHTETLMKYLKRCVEPMKSYLTMTDTVVETFRKWFESLIGYEPIFLFSEVSNFLTTMKIKDSDKQWIWTFNKLSWIQKLFDKLIPLAESYLKKLNIRLSNVDPVSIDDVIKSLQNDEHQKHRTLCNEIVKLLKGYEALYKPIKLKGVLKTGIKFDYVELCKKHESRIANMKDGEQKTLNTLITGVMQSLIQHPIAVTKLKDLCKSGLEISDNVRMTVIHDLKEFYGRENQTENIDQLMQIKMKLQDGFDNAKKAKTSSDAAIDREVKTIKNDVLATFKELAGLPEKLQKILEAPPAK